MLFKEGFDLSVHAGLFVRQVYDLGADGQGMSRVAAMSQSSVVSAAGNIAR